MGQRVLLCDFDPQANATSGMGVDKSLSLGIYDVLLNNIEPEKRVVPTRYGDVLPSSKGLAGKNRLTSSATCKARLVLLSYIVSNTPSSSSCGFSHGKPISAYDRTSRGSEAYAALAQEFLRKNQK